MLNFLSIKTGQYHLQIPQGDTISTLEEQLGELRVQIQRIETTLRQQGVTIVTIGTIQARLPNTAVISPKFLNRAFAI